MKAIKSAALIVFITAAAYFTGCGDQVITPNTGSGSNETIRETGSGVYLFHDHLRLKANHSCAYSFENTGLYSFGSVSIPDCELMREGLEINGYNDDEAMQLGCHEKGFYAKTIEIRNPTNKFLEVDILLGGSKVKVPYPPVKRKDTEE